MMHVRVWDTETIPRLDVPPECDLIFNPDDVNIPANWGAEAATKKIEGERKKFEKNADHKRNVNPQLCRPCSFCGFDSKIGEYLELFAKNEEEEVPLLSKARDWLTESYNMGIPLVGFNSKAYDLQMLQWRSMVLDVAGMRPDIYYKLLDHRLENMAHIDLMLSLGIRTPFSGKPTTEKQDWYCAYFGLPGKIGDWTGASVWPAFKEGWFDDIQIYNRGDVDALYGLFCYVAPWVVDFSRMNRGAAALDESKISE